MQNETQAIGDDRKARDGNIRFIHMLLEKSSLLEAAWQGTMEWTANPLQPMS